MSYTNSTPNLHLPQYIATDKPTYLGDWNASMQTIDTVMTTTQATANGASSTAISANSTAQVAQQSANTANTKADNNATDIAALKNNLTKKTFTVNTNSSDYNWGLQSVTCNEYFADIAFNTANSNLQEKGTIKDTKKLNVLFSINENIFSLPVDTITGSNNKSLPGFTHRYYNSPDGDVSLFGITVKAYWDGANTVFFTEIPNTTITQNNNIAVWGNASIIF